jgi:hypothetical protein
MFGNRGTNGTYRPVNLGEFSDDSSDEGDDFIQRSVKAQQVRRFMTDSMELVNSF